MSHSTFTIDLNAAEQDLLREIELDALALQGHEAVRRNCDLAAQLMELLIARNAIPSHRVSYFTDPDYYVGGRGSSRQQIFERNGTSGRDIFRHPHFLAHLRYFLHGPDLPAPVIAAFADRIEDCGPVTSGDIQPLSQLARELTRRHRLEPRKAAEEFFRLALEHGLSPGQARPIRDSVQAVRPAHA